jgi:hypothetical protein
MAKAINLFCTKIDALDKAYESIKAVTKETLTEFDLEIEAKKMEIDRLEEQDSHDRKRRKTEADLELAEYRYDAAINILDERGEVAIPDQVLKEMKDRLAHITEERDAELQKAIAAEKGAAQAALKAAVNNATLTHKAETAILNATNETQKTEIQNLRKTIDNLQNEIAEQRKLTAQIAEAGRAAPISQQFGK